MLVCVVVQIVFSLSFTISFIFLILLYCDHNNNIDNFFIDIILLWASIPRRLFAMYH